MEVAASWVAPIAATEMGGKVIAGLRLGRLLGVPTANIALRRYDPRLFGSWAAFALAGDRLHEAIAHVGVRPSVGAAEPLLEVHLFDFDGDLYGEHLQVRLLRRISEEVRLESLELLRGKIEEDVRRVRRYFEALRAHPHARVSPPPAGRIVSAHFRGPQAGAATETPSDPME